jgi:MarR family transcriptional regulator, organic hydroperoxide resistance regulator
MSSVFPSLQILNTFTICGVAGNRHDLTELLGASLGSPDRAVGFVLWRVLHRYVREAERVLSGTGLTHLQFQTLALAAWLGRDGEPVTQSELAKSGDIGAMQVSHMMKALEDKGWITRVRSTTDPRAKNVEVTKTGVAVLRKAFPPMIALQREMFGADGAPGGPLLDALHRAESSTPGA